MMNEFPDWYPDEDSFGGVPTRERPLGVGELLVRIKNVLAGGIGQVSVHGEIHSLTKSSAGHIYFDLKDEKLDRMVRCVMFRGAAQYLQFAPKTGDKVDITAEVGIYEPRGSLQLMVRSMKPAGIGDLYLEFMRIKNRLLAQGVFDAAKRHKLPKLPNTVGIVTSLAAAALQDVLQTLRNAAPWVNVVIYPASVQGDMAERELCEAVKKAGSRRKVDVLLIARGGGSLADLWSFNSEALARVIAALPIPTISGVGHETDFTITDMAVTERAATPTAAANLAVSGWVEAFEKFNALHPRLRSAMQQRITLASASLRAAGNPETACRKMVEKRSLSLRLVHEKLVRVGSSVLNNANQRLDLLEVGLAGGPSNILNASRQRVASLHVRLSQSRPDASLGAARLEVAGQALSMAGKGIFEKRCESLNMLEARLAGSSWNALNGSRQRADAAGLRLIKNRPDIASASARVDVAGRALAIAEKGILDKRSSRLDMLLARLESMETGKVLARGFSIVQGADGKVLKRIEDYVTGQPIGITTQGGSVKANVSSVVTAKSDSL